MIDCWECGTLVSAADTKCPICSTRLKKPGSGFFVTILKWEFILFNCMMVAWLVNSLGGAEIVADTSSSSAIQTSSENTMTLGTTIIITIWVMGDLILGIFLLLTLPKNYTLPPRTKYRFRDNDTH